MICKITVLKSLILYRINIQALPALTSFLSLAKGYSDCDLYKISIWIVFVSIRKNLQLLATIFVVLVGLSVNINTDTYIIIHMYLLVCVSVICSHIYEYKNICSDTRMFVCLYVCSAFTFLFCCLIMCSMHPMMMLLQLRLRQFCVAVLFTFDFVVLFD